MNDAIRWILAAGGGSTLAVFYFGGLWWTLRQLPRSRSPLSIYFVSFVVRSVAALIVFYCLMSYHTWQSLAVCLVGFTVTRYTLLYGLSPDRMCPDMLSRIKP